MKLDAGVEALPSISGVLFTILLTLMVLGYTIQKTEVLVNRRDSDIMSVINKDFYAADEDFQFSQGLSFAVAFTAYDDETEMVLDPSIGQVVIESYEFGTTAVEKYKTLPTHMCSEKELGIID